ncbi:MAG: HEPN domain-containing protein, partial [Candidatus Thiodiazotropha sp.]
PPAVMLNHAREYFEEWTESGDGFMAGAKFQQSEGRLKIAAFDLHQAAERYITCLLLVYTGYRPKEHDMAKLLQQGAGFAQELHALFPNDSQEEQHLFDLLRRAYVDARYSRAYQIDDDEFEGLYQWVLRLKQIVTKLCQDKIKALQSA